VWLLIKKGADVTKHDNDGRKPLYLALQNGSISMDYQDVAQLLIEKGADVDKPDKNGRTLLFFRFAHLDVARLLIDKGADGDLTSRLIASSPAPSPAVACAAGRKNHQHSINKSRCPETKRKACVAPSQRRQRRRGGALSRPGARVPRRTSQPPVSLAAAPAQPSSPPGEGAVRVCTVRGRERGKGEEKGEEGANRAEALLRRQAASGGTWPRRVVRPRPRNPPIGAVAREWR
jgi:hypothetical protein